MPDEILAPLRAIADVGVWLGPSPIDGDRLAVEAASADGLLSMLNVTVDARVLDACPNLRVVSQMAVGVDNIDVAACIERGIAVGHTPDVLTETVADTAFALAAAAVRRLPEGERVVREGRWGEWDPWFLLGRDLNNTTLGIVGMGRIGQAIARRASGFSMEVLYDSPGPKAVDNGTRVTLGELLEESDIVMLSAPLTKETTGLIGAAELALMKPTAYLVNVARGQLVVTDDLVEALRARSIAGAALDVTDPEPIPADHPLLGFENCLVVPHIGSASVRARTAMARLAVDNLIAGLTGAELPARLPAT